ncbi:MAG: ATP-binding protein, partial [Methanotrichaceae archaeon]
MAGKAIMANGPQILRPKARIMRIIGEELVSSEIVAITELVKNSYDADATHVLIRFTGPLEAGKGAIEVIDNGHGMSLSDVQKTWMEPATLYRKQKTKSQWFGRRVLGEKGIGRFAASRLADRLEVITRQKDSDNELHVYFDWSQFDDDTKYLDEIEVSYQITEALNISPDGVIKELWSEDESVEENWMVHGTIMRMQGLRKTWTKAQIELLRTNLSRFVSPFIIKSEEWKSNDLLIYLKFSPPFDDLSGQIQSPDALEHPLYSVTGSVNENGDYDLFFRLKEQDEEHKTGKFALRKGDKPTCGPFYIELRAWERDTKSLKDLSQYYGLTVGEIRNLLDDAAGISIYRDGFRIMPYGEPKNDWLRLDLRRVQNPERFSNNQIVGYILISADNNPSLRDQSNREGIMEGQALDDLGDLVIDVITELEARKHAIKDKEKKEIRDREQKDLSQFQKDESNQQFSNGPSAAKTGIFKDFDLRSVHSFIETKHPKDKELLALVGAKDRQIEVKLEQMQEVLARYQRLATLGHLIDRVLHEGQAPLSKIGNEAILGLKDIKLLKSNTQDLIQKLDKRLNFIKAQSDVLASVFRKIGPFGGRKRGKPMQVNLKKAISDAI